MFIATIVRNKKNGRLYARVDTEPQTSGDVEVVEILNGTDKKALEKRAATYIEELLDEANAP